MNQGLQFTFTTSEATRPDVERLNIEKNFPVFVKVPQAGDSSPRTITVNVTPGTMISRILELTEDELDGVDLFENELTISYAGKILELDRSVEFYNIPTNATLDINGRLSGGHLSDHKLLRVKGLLERSKRLVNPDIQQYESIFDSLDCLLRVHIQAQLTAFDDNHEW